MIHSREYGIIKHKTQKRFSRGRLNWALHLPKHICSDIASNYSTKQPACTVYTPIIVLTIINGTFSDRRTKI